MKCTTGFTLLEVMISVAIIGIMMSSIGALENTLITSVLKYTDLFERVLQETLFFHESKPLYKDKPLKKKTINPDLELEFTRKDIPKESILHAIGALQFEFVESIRTGNQRERLVSMIYKKPEKKSKKI